MAKKSKGEGFDRKYSIPKPNHVQNRNSKESCPVKPRTTSCQMLRSHMLTFEAVLPWHCHLPTTTL
eukprot:6090311-Amphidinium_carterae.1